VGIHSGFGTFPAGAKIGIGDHQNQGECDKDNQQKHDDQAGIGSYSSFHGHLQTIQQNSTVILS
jgi:hypothetical protein